MFESPVNCYTISFIVRRERHSNAFKAQDPLAAKRFRLVFMALNFSMTRVEPRTRDPSANTNATTSARTSITEI